jgi:hypothetical protein
MHTLCLGCGAECNSAIHQFVINARVSECSPSIIIAGVAGVVSHYVPTLTWLVRAAACILYPRAAVCACRRAERELKHNHYGNALRNENSRAHCISYCIPTLSMHIYTCRICALIYTQANKSRMNFFLITRDIKERARLERSLNYYRSTAAFASRCAAGNPLQQSTFQDSRITLSGCTVHTHCGRRQDGSNRERVEVKRKSGRKFAIVYLIRE